LLLALDAPSARALVRHRGGGVRRLLGSTRRGRGARRWRGRESVGVIPGPALLPPLRGPRVDIDRVQASEDLHAPLSPVIATLDRHEGAAATDPLCIGVRLVRRNAEVCERLTQAG